MPAAAAEMPEKPSAPAQIAMTKNNQPYPHRPL
jgi:hypothetical protein